AVVSVTQINTGAAVAGWQLATNLQAPGVVRASLAGSTPLAPGVGLELLTLDLRAEGAAGSSSALNLTRGDIDELTGILSDGEVTIASPRSSLNVDKDGTGTGSVASSPAGIDCGSDCSERYVTGTVVTLTATPASDSSFVGWSGGGCSGTGTCEVTMSIDQNVTASFTKALNPTVTVTARDASASEAGLTTGTYTFSRTGSTSAALAVAYTVSGTATSGSDYQSLGTSVNFGAGVTKVTKTLTPLQDTLQELPESVIVTLKPGTSYAVGTPGSATVTLTSDGQPPPAPPRPKPLTPCDPLQELPSVIVTLKPVPATPLAPRATVPSPATKWSPRPSPSATITAPPRPASHRHLYLQPQRQHRRRPHRRLSTSGTVATTSPWAPASTSALGLPRSPRPSPPGKTPYRNSPRA
ncbi:MAG: hypothetical protein IPN92_11850, partial [Chromatiaceae bacterium]|nr:hypothetical protein [Chromatiaceae bacterium]